MPDKIINRDTFRSVFIRNEFRAVSGRNHSTIGYLAAIMFISFLTFGFTRSTMLYKQKLSADPFSNWINLNYHSGTGDSLRALSDKIQDETFRERFHIRGGYFYNKGMVSLRSSAPGRGEILAALRTIDPQSRVVRDLVESRGCVTFFPDTVADPFACNPNGVIISEKLCKETGLDAATLSFIQLKTPAGDFVPVPVLAVVDALPDLAGIVCSNLFYCKTMNPGFYDRDNAGYRVYIENMDTAQILMVLQELAALKIADPLTVQTTVLITGNAKTLNWLIAIGAGEIRMTAGELDERLAAMTSLKRHQYGRYFELSADTTCDRSAFFHDYLAIEFADLERIREFSEYLTAELALELHLEVLSERENYLYTGNMAAGALILLMIFSALALSAYLSAVIRNHLLRIRKNLGNFLAFGVKNSTLTGLYICVSVMILVAAMIPALALAMATGSLVENYIPGRLIMADPAQDYFTLANSWFLIFAGGLFIVAIARTLISVRQILKCTPGDLIYERD